MLINIKKKIETLEDFLAWANEVNTNGNIKDKNELQDIFARSDSSTLKDIFIKVGKTNNSRRMLLFSIIKSQGEDAAFEFINDFVTARVNDVIHEYEQSTMYPLQEELERKIGDVDVKLNYFIDAEKTYKKQITDMEEKQKANQNYISRMERDIEELGRQKNRMQNTINEMKPVLDAVETLKDFFNK